MMIYDRTEFDATEARRIRLEKVQQGLTLTDAEKETLSRGTISIDTLNRIEEKCAELVDIFALLGYDEVSGVISKAWSYEDIFHPEELSRILNNLNILRNAYFVYAYTPPTPQPRYHYTAINAIEKILHDLEELTDKVSQSFVYCGTIHSGGVFL